MNSKVILAVFRRDFSSYFSNPTGYVFVTIFIFMSAIAAFWSEQFFLGNLANLKHLNELMPYLLMVFVPAITMTSWSGEKASGTAELLLTLPARDTEIVIGKYLAALGIYVVSLLFSLSHVFVLEYLGDPDLGVMFGTYLGYFFMGAMLLSIGLVASVLTRNATIGFIYGAAFSAVFVFADKWGGFFFSGATARFFEDISVPKQFEAFGEGRFLLSSIVYSLSTTAVFLFINAVLVGRRHWVVKEGGEMWWHQITRSVSLLVAAVSLVMVFDALGWGGDLTQEDLHTLSAQTETILDDLDADRPVIIEAFVSPKVPKEYVSKREKLLSTLKEFDRLGGGAIKLRIYETEKYTPEARRAADNYGIRPQGVPTERGSIEEVYLAVAFTCGTEEDVIIFAKGLSVEYELARSLRVVSQSGRKTVGVMRTEAKLTGGFDPQSFQRIPQWAIVQELRRQYEIREVSGDEPIPGDIDALLVALPSTLTQPQLDNLRAWSERGGPTLLLLDPYPYFNPGLAPVEKRGGMSMGRPQRGPQEPKGNIKGYLDSVGIAWDKDQIAWQTYSPHLQYESLPPELMFIGEGSGAEPAFDPEHPATSGLQELVVIYGGSIKALPGGEKEFTPLMRTNRNSGRNSIETIAPKTFMGRRFSPRVPHLADVEEHIVAGQVAGPVRENIWTKLREELEAEAKKLTEDSQKDYKAPLDRIAKALAAKRDDDKLVADIEATLEKLDSREAKKALASEIRDKLNGSLRTIRRATRGRVTIALADVDAIGENFFAMRRQGVEDLNFDNVTFVLNCVDVLCQEDAFSELRKKRARHRTLTRLEETYSEFNERLLEEEKKAEKQAEAELEKANKAFQGKIDAIDARADLDPTSKAIEKQRVRQIAQRKLDVRKAQIDDDKKSAIDRSAADKAIAARSIERNIRVYAVALPPLPALIIGLIVFFIRRSRENLGAVESRLVRKS